MGSSTRKRKKYIQLYIYKPPRYKAPSECIEINSIYSDSLELNLKTGEQKTYFDSHCYSLFLSPFSILVTSPLRIVTSPLILPHKTPLKAHGYRAFSFAAPALWNELLQNIRCRGCLNQFKRLVKSYLSKKAFNL